MAMEKLHDLHTGGRFDLVVVDTPPTRNALDFLDAPRRLTRFLDHKLFPPAHRPGAQLPASRVGGGPGVPAVDHARRGRRGGSDVLAFFTAFEGMEEGFRQRATAVYDLLEHPDTAFVLVASPRRDAVDEALFFAAKLGEARITVQALVVNRVHPAFGGGLPPRGGAPAPPGSALALLEQNMAELDAVAGRERTYLATLTRKVAPAPPSPSPSCPVTSTTSTASGRSAPPCSPEACGSAHRVRMLSARQAARRSASAGPTSSEKT